MAQEMKKQISNMKAHNSEHLLVMTNILLLHKEQQQNKIGENYFLECVSSF